MENQEQEQVENGHSLFFRHSLKVDAYKRKRQWRKEALEALNILNDIKLEESATSEYNIQVFEALREKLRILKRIDPNKKIYHDTLVETTVIKYDCPMCLPTDDSVNGYELDNN